MSRRKGLTIDECLEFFEEFSENSSDGGGSSDPEFVVPVGEVEHVSSSSEEETKSDVTSSCTANDNQHNAPTPTNLRSSDAGTDSDVINSSPATGNQRNALTPANLRARDGTEWKILNHGGTVRGRFGVQNVMKDKKGPTPYARRHIGDNEASSWHLLFSESMLKNIQKCTIEEAHRQLESDSWDISLIELEVFIALVYARGAMNYSSLDMNDMWSKEWGPSVFAETMSRDRFNEILRFLRFDRKTTRSTRLINDKFALASELWSSFVENSQLCFTAGEYITVDEQLLPCKARCKFIQYMVNKPDKFGLKFWFAVDLETKYFLNGFMYLGKDEERDRSTQLSEHVVLKLMAPFLYKGKNATTDNFFTSQKLADSLLTKGTSIVGTMRPNRRELPAICKDTSGERFSSTILANGQNTLTVYRYKPRKNVCILSTMHKQVEISDNNKKHPVTVIFYNSTKCGVDVLDQMSRLYTTGSASRRWPLYIFYNVLDFAAINAWILFRACNSSEISRRCFILNLVNELRSSHCLTTRRPTTLPCGTETTVKNAASTHSAVTKRQISVHHVTSPPMENAKNAVSRRFTARNVSLVNEAVTDMLVKSV